MGGFSPIFVVTYTHGRKKRLKTTLNMKHVTKRGTVIFSSKETLICLIHFSLCVLTKETWVKDVFETERVVGDRTSGLFLTGSSLICHPIYGSVGMQRKYFITLILVVSKIHTKSSCWQHGRSRE